MYSYDFPFDAALKSETFKIDLLPGYEHRSAPHVGSIIEHVLVLEGKVEVLLENHWNVIQKGEGIQFSAHQVHGYRNVGREMASFFNIIYYL